MGPTLLIIDDSSTMRSQLRAALEAAFDEITIYEEADGLAGYKAMLTRRPDLVLCDLVMPGFDGQKLLTMRSQRPETAAIPVIMLTAADDIERKVELLDKGAADYVTKPFHPKELAARVRVHLRLKLLSDEVQAANARLEALATTDELTGLSNRRLFEQLLALEHQRTIRYKTPLSIALVDVDNFKDVNDTYGHQMGDEVLRNLGTLIHSAIRTTDLAARYGGEEICILLPHTPLAGAMELAERLRILVEQATHILGDHTISKTISIGVACSLSGEETSAELLKRADEALYAAKRSGRNRVVS